MATGDMVRVRTCGLYVVTWRHPTQWQNFSDTKLGIDPADGDGRESAIGAFGQTRLEAIKEGADDIALCCSHYETDLEEGDVDVEAFSFADFEVSDDVLREEAEETEPQVLTWFTICGLDQNSFNTLNYQVEAVGPWTAFMMAFKKARHSGKYLLLGCMHNGKVPYIGRLPFADPACETEQQMADKLAEWDLPSEPVPEDDE